MSFDSRNQRAHLKLWAWAALAAAVATMLGAIFIESGGPEMIRFRVSAKRNLGVEFELWYAIAAAVLLGLSASVFYATGMFRRKTDENVSGDANEKRKAETEKRWRIASFVALAASFGAVSAALYHLLLHLTGLSGGTIATTLTTFTMSGLGAVIALACLISAPASRKHAGIAFAFCALAFVTVSSTL